VRTLIAVLAGGVVAAVLFQLGAVIALLSSYGIPLGASPTPPGPGYFALNLGCSAIAAVVGGWVTARVAGDRPLAHAGAVGVLLGALVLWGFAKPASQWPAWYPLVLALVGLAGLLLGAALWRSRTPG